MLTPEANGPLIQVDRVGKNGELFKLYKFAGGETHNFDEAAQILNILGGDMRPIGHRPISPSDFEEFFDSLDHDQREEYSRLVLPTFPGIFSSFALKIHSGESATPLQRWEMDVTDVSGGAAAKRDIARRAIILGLTHYMPNTMRRIVTPRQ